MGRFRNGVPQALQALILAKHIPTEARNLKVTLHIEDEPVGTQWIHSEAGFAAHFGDRNNYRWDILARTFELIEALNGYRDGHVTDVVFENADKPKDNHASQAQVEA